MLCVRNDEWLLMLRLFYSTTRLHRRKKTHKFRFEAYQFQRFLLFFFLFVLIFVLEYINELTFQRLCLLIPLYPRRYHQMSIAPLHQQLGVKPLTPSPTTKSSRMTQRAWTRIFESKRHRLLMWRVKHDQDNEGGTLETANIFCKKRKHQKFWVSPGQQGRNGLL